MAVQDPSRCQLGGVIDGEGSIEQVAFFLVKVESHRAQQGRLDS